MPKLIEPRHGTELWVKGRPLPFSLWPMYRRTRRYGLQSSVFVSDPWSLIRASIEDRCQRARRAEADAFVVQAEEFFSASVDGRSVITAPLLLYYSFLNLAKAFCLLRGHQTSFGKAQHGISEQLKGTSEVANAVLRVFPSPRSDGGLNVFAELLRVLNYPFSADRSFPVPELLPQVVPGHRLWCDAAARKERFVAIEHIQIMHNERRKEVWLRLFLSNGDLGRLGYAQKDVIRLGRLPSYWSATQAPADVPAEYVCFEQLRPTSYTGRASDVVQKVVASLRPSLWTIVTTVPPYRRYYVYLAPKEEHESVLPQLASIYALAYYLGSITRYRPQVYESILSTKHGNQLREFLASQPTQFLYLIASEFAEREVTKPAIV